MEYHSGIDNAFKLFKEVYATSLAYRKFLQSEDVNGAEFNVVTDLSRVPLMDKKSYINKYPLSDRLFEGKQLADFYMLCSSSGSTGEPTFWPRDIKTDNYLEKKKEQLYEEHFAISKKKTLCIVTLALGSWTGGMLTAKLSWAAGNNNKFTVITPGISKETTYQLIEKLYTHYDQILILGYPPFITDLIEFSKKRTKDLKKYNMKLMCTGERFSEEWRSDMINLISQDKNRGDVVSFYACSDTGIIGCETKFTINLVGQALSNKSLALELFGTTDIPSFVAYDSKTKYLECINGEIVITARQPAPLVRYNIHDRGGLLTKNQIIAACLKYNIKYSEKDLNENYVYIFGRSDSVQITANIYIEDIKYCLDHSKFRNRFVHYFRFGKEKLLNMRYRLKVIIYTKQNVKFTQEEKIYFHKEFYNNLVRANDDFRAIQQGTKIEKFNIIFEEEKGTKLNTIKLKYFL